MGTSSCARGVLIRWNLPLYLAAHFVAVSGWGADLPPMKIREGFRVDLVHAVDRDTEGSWIALTVDDRGRLIASDQFGRLYRIESGDFGQTPGNETTSHLRPSQKAKVECLSDSLGHAHGLLYAFDALYTIVGENQYEGPGLYRSRDTDGDDRFDEVRLLKKLAGSGEHGPHSIVLGPDGKSLYLCAGNKTHVPEFDRSMVPPHWGEDELMPRIWGPVGSERGTPAPGGWIARTDPDGREIEIFAVGFRNEFDIAFNRDGELFTFDADAEFDMGTPWYQPTRVFHVVSGVDFGWRSGAGKWPPYQADTLPPIAEVGPGSPTGVTFAYAAKFPDKYREALFLCDWSYGRLFALHLKPQGGSYRGELEEILSGTPLPITDLVVNPHDGAMYFTLGGRRTTSGLYRLRYVGPLEGSGTTSSLSSVTPPAMTARRQLEEFHRAGMGLEAVEFAWPFLAHEDRFVRHAARIVLEHASADVWRQRALAEPDPASRLTAMLALARCGERSLLPRFLASLGELDWNALSPTQRLTLLRCYEVALIRMLPDGAAILAAESGPQHPSGSVYLQKIVPELADLERRLEAIFPSGERRVDPEICKLLVYLQSPNVASKTLRIIASGTSKQEQLQYAISLRHLRAGWTPELRRKFFGWLDEASTWAGGLSFTKSIETIRSETLDQVPVEERHNYASTNTGLDRRSAVAPVSSRPLVRKWSLEEWLELRDHDQANGDQENGRRMFAAVACFDCHRFAGEGATVGPDLTAVAGRFSTRDLLESILDPSKTISDQYAATTVVTGDGRVITGRVVNIVRDTLMIQTDMLRPAELVRMPISEIDEMRPSKTSMMPTGLLDTLTKKQIVDLIAYLSSGRTTLWDQTERYNQTRD